MNAGDAVPLFAGMLTQRPWEEITKKQVGWIGVGRPGSGSGSGRHGKHGWLPE